MSLEPIRPFIEGAATTSLILVSIYLILSGLWIIGVSTIIVGIALGLLTYPR